jgi:hypothetical protein
LKSFTRFINWPIFFFDGAAELPADPAGRTRKIPQMGFAVSQLAALPQDLRALEDLKALLGAGGIRINYWLNRKTQQRHLSGICSPGSAALITGPLKSPAWIGLRGRKKVQRTAMQIRPPISRS